MLLVMTAAVAACIAGCSKEDIEAAREAGTNAVSKVADKTIELSDEAKGVVDRTKEHIHERIVKMPEETTRQAAEILGAAGEGAKDASSARRTAKNKPYPRNAQKRPAAP